MWPSTDITSLVQAINQCYDSKSCIQVMQVGSLTFINNEKN